MGPVNLNFQLSTSKIGGDMGFKKNFPTSSLKIDTYDFRNFLHVSPKLVSLKTLKVSKNSVRYIRRYFTFYILPEYLVYVNVQILQTESILLRSDYDTPSHSAWSESSAACPRPRGGRRGGEKLAPGAFATFQRRGPQGRAHILVVFVKTAA